MGLNGNMFFNFTPIEQLVWISTINSISKNSSTMHEMKKLQGPTYIFYMYDDKYIAHCVSHWKGKVIEALILILKIHTILIHLGLRNIMSLKTGSQTVLHREVIQVWLWNSPGQEAGHSPSSSFRLSGYWDPQSIQLWLNEWPDSIKRFTVFLSRSTA